MYAFIQTEHLKPPLSHSFQTDWYPLIKKKKKVFPNNTYTSIFPYLTQQPCCQIICLWLVLPVSFLFELLEYERSTKR